MIEVEATPSPFLVRRRSLLPEWRHQRTDDLVDLGPLEGTEVPLAKTEVQRIYGLGSAAMEFLVKAGLFALHSRSGRRSHYFIHPGETLADAYDRWVIRRGLLTTHTDFFLHRSVHRNCHLPVGRPLAPILLESAFRLLAQIGNFTRTEINVLLPLDDVNYPPVRQWFTGRISAHCDKRPIGSRGAPVSLEMLNAAVPAALRTLPRTCFASGTAHESEPPPESVRRRLWAMGELFASASLFALVIVPRLRKSSHITTYLAPIERVEEIMRTWKPQGEWSADDYVAGLRSYAIDKAIRPTDLPAVRYETLRVWRLVTDKLIRYARQHDRDGRLGIAAHVPPRFRISRPLNSELQALYGNLREEGHAARKQASWDALAELDPILEAAENRRDEVREFGLAVRAEIDAIGPREQFRTFEVTVPILDARGLLAGGIQEVAFKLWRVSAAWRSLDLSTSSAWSTRTAAIHREKTSMPDLAGMFVVEYLGTSGIDGAEVIEPWMIPFSELNVWCAAGLMPPTMQERRHRTIVAKGLPGYASVKGGLLILDRERATLARNAAREGRHFFPLEEIEHGMRLAYHALDCVAQTFQRLEGVRQQRRTGWKEEPDLPGEPRHSQTVIPKVPRRDDLADAPRFTLTVREETLNEALDLCELEMRRCRLTSFPITAPPDDIGWKLPHADYLMMHDGTALTHKDLILLLCYLLAGWPAFSYHIFRYVMAEDAELDGESPENTRLALGHAIPEHSDRYRKLPESLASGVDEDGIRRRIKEVDDRRARRDAARKLP